MKVASAKNKVFESLNDQKSYQIGMITSGFQALDDKVTKLREKFSKDILAIKEFNESVITKQVFQDHVFNYKEFKKFDQAQKAIDQVTPLIDEQNQRLSQVFKELENLTVSILSFDHNLTLKLNKSSLQEFEDRVNNLFISKTMFSEI